MDETQKPAKGRTGRFKARPRRFIDIVQRDGKSVPIVGWEVHDQRNGKDSSRIILMENPTEEQFIEAFREEIGNPDEFIEAAGKLHEVIQSFGRSFGQSRPELSLQSVIIPQTTVAEGILVRSTSAVWLSIIQRLKDDWSQAYSIPWRMWEEIIAGAFKRAGYDEVVLTPRSADNGRDVIATRNGVGSVRILGSVKALGPGQLVTKEQVHALMGVVSIDPNASKGLFATTSDFAPNLLHDPGIKAALPHRLELMNGERLHKWLQQLSASQSTS
jgi:restriction system protein